MMINKMSFKNIGLKFSFIVFTVFLNSCSVFGEWWYDRLDLYLANYFFEYAEFTNDQKYYIRKTTKEYKKWNSNSELPKLKNLLLEVESLDKEDTIKDIEKIIIRGRLLFKNNYSFFIPHIVILCEELTDEQVSQISSKFENRIKEWKSSLEKSKKEDSLQSSIEALSRLSKFLGVRLTKEQKNELKKLYPRLENSRPDSIKNQGIWNTEFISILNLRKKVGFKSEITTHLHSLFEDERNTGNEKVYYQMIAEVNSSLSENQRKKFKKRINFLINSLDKIIKNQK